MRETFMKSHDFGKEITGIKFQLRKENGKLFLQVHAAMEDEQRVLMEKMVMIVLNKSDILADMEVIGEYIEQFQKIAAEYIQHTFGVHLERNEIPTFLTSAMTHSGIDMWLDIVQHYLQYERTDSVLLLFDVVPVAPKPQ